MNVMRRLSLLFVVLLAFATSWVALREIPLSVVGQPTSTGLLQRDREEPFFAGLAERTGLPLAVSYRPLDSVGFKDTHQLQMLRDGQFDLVSLRFIQNSQTEPSLQGIDLVGLSSDFEAARTVVRRYAGTVDHYLQERFDAKLLGVWTFGPQVFFCRVPIHSLADLKGLKIRVASPSIATAISALGGVPAVIPFDDTRNALAIGLVDCAVSSAASAVSAGWLDHTRYYFPLPVHYGLNGYAIALRTWNQFSAQEQEALQNAFDSYVDGLWQFSQYLHHDMSQCITGLFCSVGRPYGQILVEPSEQDLQRFKDIARKRVWPEWAASCDRVHPGCSAQWRVEVLEQGN